MIFLDLLVVHFWSTILNLDTVTSAALATNDVDYFFLLFNFLTLTFKLLIATCADDIPVVTSLRMRCAGKASFIPQWLWFILLLHKLTQMSVGG